MQTLGFRLSVIKTSSLNIYSKDVRFTEMLQLQTKTGERLFSMIAAGFSFSFIDQLVDQARYIVIFSAHC